MHYKIYSTPSARWNIQTNTEVEFEAYNILRDAISSEKGEEMIDLKYRPNKVVINPAMTSQASSSCPDVSSPGRMTRPMEPCPIWSWETATQKQDKFKTKYLSSGEASVK